MYSHKVKAYVHEKYMQHMDVYSSSIHNFQNLKQASKQAKCPLNKSTDKLWYNQSRDDDSALSKHMEAS